MIQLLVLSSAFTVLCCRFMVPPMHHKDFAKKWLDMRPHMEGQHGNKKLGLYKVWPKPLALNPKPEP